jgi:hypothetical protein
LATIGRSSALIKITAEKGAGFQRGLARRD